MKNIKLEQLQAFLHVSRGCGYNSAASALHLSQPAIRARIKNLEDILGTSLFQSDATGRKLSNKGKILLHYAEQIEHIIDRLHIDIVEPDKSLRLLRMGFSQTVSYCWMPNILRNLQQEYPNFFFEIEVDTSNSLIEKLESRKIDIAFALGSTGRKFFKQIALPPIALDWYTSSSDPVADTDAMVRLFDKPVVTYPTSTHVYREIRDLVWRHIGYNTQIIASSSLNSAVKLVAEDVCVAALPAFIVDYPLRDGIIKRFCPGWLPKPLEFSLFYTNDSANPEIDNLIGCIMGSITQQSA